MLTVTAHRERMQASEGGSGRGDVIKGLVSTHPVNSARIKSIEKWVRVAMLRCCGGC